MVKPTPLVSPLNWLALVAIAALGAGVGVWAFAGIIPRMVDGRGVVLRDSEFGIYEVAGNVTGTLAKVFVKEGDLVAAGQPVAEVLRQALRNEITQTEQALKSAEDQGNEPSRIAVEAKLRELRSRLEAEQFIRSAHPGRVIEVVLAPGDVIQPDKTLMRVESSSGDHEALVYVSALEGKKIQKGMEARIVPTTAHAENSGYLRAQVKYVSAQPVTQNYLVSELGGNERLADWLLEQESRTEVVLELSRDARQSDGYAWSSGKPAASIESGLLLEGYVIFDRVRPVYWILNRDRE